MLDISSERVADKLSVMITLKLRTSYIRFDVHLDPVAGISAPTVSRADIAKLEKHFMSHRCFLLYPPKCRIPQISLCSSLEALNGFMFGVDATKSLILTLACIERVITVDEAVKKKVGEGEGC